MSPGGKPWAENTFERRGDQVLEMRSVLVGIVVVLVGLTLNSCAGGTSGDAVVSVNGTPITKAAFDHQMMAEADKGGNTVKGVPDAPTYKACIANQKAIRREPEFILRFDCEQQYFELERESLPELIKDYWVLGEASEQGVKVSEVEVEKRLGERHPTPSALKEFLLREKKALSDVLFEEKIGLLWEEIQRKVRKGVAKTPSQNEISAYSARHASQLEQRNILIIQTKTEAQAKQAKREIQAGKSFASVAARDSIYPAGWAPGGLLSHALAGLLPQAMSAANVGVLNGPIKAPGGYDVYEVKKKIPVSQQPAGQVQETITNLITGAKKEKAMSEFDSNFPKRWIARTDCRMGYIVEGCKEYNPSKPPPRPTLRPPTLPATSAPAQAVPTPTRTNTAKTITVKCNPGGACSAVP
jgi:foldase protein PrsA